MSKNILVVDDEHNIRKVLAVLIKRLGFSVFEASNGIEALEQCRTLPISVVVTDLKMPKMDGLQLLHSLNRDFPHIPVILITAHGTVETAVSAIKNGAFDYITKPFEQDEMKRVITNAMSTFQATQREYHPPFLDPDLKIIGKTRAMQEVFELVKKVADSPSSVLLMGESGTGKELVAQALHNWSPRKNKPFIKINCSAIPENLIESELFGFEKGAFTGAIMSKPGRFELADEGTLFLDEIGEISPEMQVKILRVIQEKTFERVGGLKTISVNVRLITATNRNLEQGIEEGWFREDLFYRLNVVPIQLPLLRDRKEDIPLLAQYFIGVFNEILKKSIKQVSPEVMAAFESYSWPGNVRQLENVIERMVLLTPGNELSMDQLPEELNRPTPPP
ncbi:sigma-54-dependent transcriptional regulator [Bdellovibrionota bacterium]